MANQSEADDSTENPVDLAASAVGGQNRLAEVLKVSPQAVNKWKRLRRIPPNRVLPVAKATGVPVHVLRPDLYPREYAV
jgi:DNA-binding transcriptional regulator YdaS (Cro superfamily)